MKNSYKTSKIFGLEIFSKQRLELLKILAKRQKEGLLSVIYTPNPEQLVLAKKNPAFMQVLQRADLLIPDGIGLVWASKLLAFLHKGQSITVRIAGRELVKDLLAIAPEQRLRVLIIGGRGYKALLENSKYEFVHWLEDYKQASRVIKKLKPSLVFVALGAPRQEFWIDSHRQLLKGQGVTIAMAVGGSFDYLLGKVPRAPKLLSRLGFEWLFRLVTQPWRWKRQLKLLAFIRLVLMELISYRRD